MNRLGGWATAGLNQLFLALTKINQQVQGLGGIFILFSDIIYILDDEVIEKLGLLPVLNNETVFSTCNVARMG